MKNTIMKNYSQEKVVLFDLFTKAYLAVYHLGQSNPRRKEKEIKIYNCLNMTIKCLLTIYS